MSNGERYKLGIPRNRSLVVEFALDPVAEKWISDTWAKAMGELRATSPLGKEFTETVATILARERNWVRLIVYSACE